MPLATATSRYQLEDSASGTLSVIRREAGRTTSALKDTGKALDKIGTAEQQQRLRRLESRFSSVASSSEAMQRRVERAVSHMEGAIRRDTLKAEARVMELQGRLDELGRTDSRPRVELDGYAVARSEIADLQHQLRQLARTDATARVRVLSSSGGGGSGIAGGARSGAFVGTGGAGVITSRGALIAGAATAALPAVQSLGGATVGLAGSLTGAALAGGAGYLAAGGALGVGIASIASVALPAKKRLEDLQKAQKKYDDTVTKYGKSSKQAKAAQEDYNRALHDAPKGAAEFERQLGRIKTRWDSLTRGSQGDLLGLGSYALRRANAAAPAAATDVRRVTGATNASGRDFADYLTNPQSMKTLSVLSGAFADNIDEGERTAEHLVGTFGNIARASVPFFHDGMVFLDHWTGGWEKGTHNIEATRRTIGGYVHDLQTWSHLAGVGFELLHDLVMPGQTAGNSLLGDATKQLEEWDRWAKANPQRIERFFDDSVSSTKDLASALGEVGQDLHEIADVLTPVLAKFAQLANIGGGLGLLAPTAIRYGLGRVMGGAKGGGAAGIGIGGAAAGGVGGTVAAETSAIGYLAPGVIASAALASRGLAGGLAAGRGIPMGMRSASVATPEAFAQRYSGIAGARYGMPASELGARATVGSRIAGPAKAVGRFAAPIFAIQALLGATQDNRGAGALGTYRDITSAMSFGLVKNQGQITDRNTRRDLAGLQDYVDRTGGTPTTAHGAYRQLRGLRGRRTAVNQLADRNHVSGDERATVVSAIDAEIQARKDLIPQLIDERNARSRERGATQGTNVAKAFRSDVRHLGGDKAFDELRSNLLGKSGIGGRSFSGGRQLAESGLAAAREAAKGNPALEKEYEKLERQVNDRFDRMGKKVVTVNGRILSASQKDWPRIRDALANPAEQARERVSKAFSAIQTQAIGALRDMGYSETQAKQIVAGAAGKGTGTIQGAVSNAKDTKSFLRSSGKKTASASDPFNPSLIGPGLPKGARGMRIPGSGRQDTVPLTLGMAAPGELIVNQHTERDVNRDLARAGAPPLGHRVAGETRKHSQPMQGILPGFATGGRANYNAMKREADAISARRYPYSWGGGHNASFAAPYDCSGGVSAVLHAGGVLGSPVTSGTLAGMFEPGPGPVTIYANPQHTYMSLRGRTWGTSTSRPGGGAGWFAGGPRPGFAVRHVPVSKFATGGRAGVADAVADAAISGYQSAMSQRVDDAMPTGGGSGGSEAAKRYARSRFNQYGWDGGEWRPLNSLWTRESGWNPYAVNKSSGAAGIAQSLGHGPVKLGDYRGQVDWGEDYIHDRYGTPAQAWAHEQKAGWYAEGGRIPWFGKGGDIIARRPQIIGVGDGGGLGEKISVRRRTAGPERRARSGMGQVTIQQMTIHHNAPGDTKKAIKAEVHAAFAELADELDGGVDADESEVIGA